MHTCRHTRVVNVYSLETYIDVQKLKFFGRLCSLLCDKLAKKVFIERLYQYIFAREPATECIGFIADLVRILQKYELDHYLENYVSTAILPSKSQWKCLVETSVKEIQERNLNVALQDPRLRRFSNIYGRSLHIHPVWRLENVAKCNKRSLRDLAKLNCVLNECLDNRECIYCKLEITDHLNHYIHECAKYVNTREHFWSTVINEFSVRFSVYLFNLLESEITEIILGKTPDFTLADDEQAAFLAMAAKVWQILTYEHELPFY